MPRTTPPRAEPIDRLRDDVRLLGELVGEVLREQGGPRAVRGGRAHAHGGDAPALAGRRRPRQERALLGWAERQSTARLLQLVRAFSVYFHLINLAEQHHRVRTLRERAARGRAAARVDRRRASPTLQRRRACRRRRCGRAARGCEVPPGLHRPPLRGAAPHAAAPPGAAPRG